MHVNLPPALQGLTELRFSGPANPVADGLQRLDEIARRPESTTEGAASGRMTTHGGLEAPADLADGWRVASPGGA